MGTAIKLLTTGGVMGFLDFIWLSYIAKKMYQNSIGSILLEKPNMLAALLFYIIYVIGVVVFVLNPALTKNSLAHATAYGALFGLVCYATYDLTALAALKGFDIKIVAIDLLWGTFLTSVVASVTFLVVR